MKWKAVFLLVFFFVCVGWSVRWLKGVAAAGTGPAVASGSSVKSDASRLRLVGIAGAVGLLSDGSLLEPGGMAHGCAVAGVDDSGVDLVCRGGRLRLTVSKRASGVAP